MGKSEIEDLSFVEEIFSWAVDDLVTTTRFSVNLMEITRFTCHVYRLVLGQTFAGAVSMELLSISLGEHTPISAL